MSRMQRFLTGCFWVVAAAVAASVFVEPVALRAAEAEQSSPKAAVKRFQQALVDRDVAAVQRLVLGEPGHAQAAEALAEMTAAAMDLEAAAQRKFGQSLQSSGNPTVKLNIPDPNAVNYAKVDSDGQFATVTVEGEDEPHRVKRVGDEWRIDMTSAKARTEADLLTLARMIRELTPTVRQLTADIESGKLKTVEAARYAFVFGLVRETMRAATTTGPTTSTTRPTTQRATPRPAK